MWDNFESSKTAILRERGEVFAQEAALREVMHAVVENSKCESTSRLKSRLLACLLQTAELRIGSEDIFAYRIGHFQLMQEFTWQRVDAVRDAMRGRGQPDWEGMVAYRANMDFGHIAPDWQYLLQRGIPGVMEDLAQGGDTAYYAERYAVYAAIRDAFSRFSAMAGALHTPKGDFIAENMEQLASGAPQTLAQAMQLILLYYVIQTDLDMVTVRSLGGLDRLLCPFYKNDLARGRYTKAQLAEITKYFLWDISCMEVTANLPFYICGMDENGGDATSEFTAFLLQVYREMDIYDPKVHVMYHPDMDRTVLRLILTMIREGKNSFVFINTPLASRALEGIGIAPEDAGKVIVYGCYETAAEGTEVPCTCGGMVNLAKSVELVLKEGEYADFDGFYEAVMASLSRYTVSCMDTIAAYEGQYHNVCPSLIMSPTFRRSRETGIDLYSGGAKYNNTSVVGAGLATLTDSLLAVKKLVFEEKRVTLAELQAILASNWETAPHLRLLVRKQYPKFGNNEPEADALAADIYERFTSLINGRKNGRGGVFRAGLFSVDWRYWMGKATGATPDGRFRGDPLSKNLAASAGQDKNGVTAYLNSLLKLDAEKCPDGYVADVALHCSAMRGEAGMRAFAGLLSAFMEQGGFAVHFNILSPEALRSAQKEPEKYRNLQIRVCGWNARFVDLDRALQDEFISQSGNVM